MFRRVSLGRAIAAAVSSAVGMMVLSTTNLGAAAGQAVSGPKIWDGVYTAAQADRGKTAFLSTCVLCHKSDLSGGQGPTLKGDRFMANWEGESLNQLFVKVRDTMPPDFGLLEPQTKIDIVAYLIEANGFPAGSVELGQDAATLDDIQIVKKGAPLGIANFSLVQTVGCLTHGPADTWSLTRASEPVATKSDGPTPSGLNDGERQPLGTDTFLLNNVTRFRPESHGGHKLEAKGLLYRAPDDNRITLTSLTMVSSTCE
jgi:cytochrome c5